MDEQSISPDDCLVRRGLLMLFITGLKENSSVHGRLFNNALNPGPVNWKGSGRGFI